MPTSRWRPVRSRSWSKAHAYLAVGSPAKGFATPVRGSAARSSTSHSDVGSTSTSGTAVCCNSPLRRDMPVNCVGKTAEVSVEHDHSVPSGFGAHVLHLMVVAHLATGGFARDGQRHLAGSLHEPDRVAPVSDHDIGISDPAQRLLVPQKSLVRTRWCHVRRAGLHEDVVPRAHLLQRTDEPVERPRPHAYGHEHAEAVRRGAQ